jgi:hypothetical protein
MEWRRFVGSGRKHLTEGKNLSGGVKTPHGETYWDKTSYFPTWLTRLTFLFAVAEITMEE